jgi:FkbM family methyltransferase
VGGIPHRIGSEKEEMTEMKRIWELVKHGKRKLAGLVQGAIMKSSRQGESSALPAFSDTATLEDLRYCYRLLLHREPDPGGWTHWKDQIEQRRYPLARLTEGFLNCVEFRAQRQALRQPLLVELADFRMFVLRNDWTIGMAVTTNKVWEPHVTQEIRRLLMPGTAFVDIGANIGYFTLLAASLVGTAGRVMAVEPNPDNCELIVKSVRVNGFNNVQVYPYAVAEKEQQFVLGVDGSNSGIFEVEQGIGHSGPVVQAKTLDELLKDEPRIDLIKIDIEGAEVRALMGMFQVLQRHRPVIFTEFFPVLLQRHSGATAEEYLQGLRQFGYTFFILHRDGKKSEMPQSNAQIMACLARLGNPDDAYLDLVAYPS